MADPAPAPFLLLNQPHAPTVEERLTDVENRVLGLQGLFVNDNLEIHGDMEALQEAQQGLRDEVAHVDYLAHDAHNRLAFVNIRLRRIEGNVQKIQQRLTMLVIALLLGITAVIASQAKWFPLIASTLLKLQ